MGAGGSWLARSVEHVTLDLRVVSSNPTLGVEITIKRQWVHGTLSKQNSLAISLTFALLKYSANVSFHSVGPL